MTTRRLLALLVLAAGLPAAAAAQLGEAHFGVIGSFGSQDPYQWGGGLTASYQPGRIAYVGLQWIYYGGSTAPESDSTGSYLVSTRAQLFGADLGLEFPIGKVEVVAGVTLGVMRFRQGTVAAGAPSIDAVGTEFVLAPTLQVQMRAGPVVLIPELGYYLSGSPDFRWPIPTHGLVTSLLVVLPIETRRIRY